ncbi:MAG: PAS domain-containing protein [Rhodocyclaceae bacterium]|jgi:PAS domain S-box-containing protein|nr:PAS domain-containing protein [Rhodocyclaceae bacterium]
MKPRNIVPTAIERVMKPDEYIISTTDTGGRITSVNDVFVDYSGYAQKELLRSQHNIVRHPDTPRSIFWLAWETLKEGGDFYGYLKNMSKDGGYYWVFAHIQPEYGGGEIVGYRSVRRVPRREALGTIAALYRDVRAAERTVPAKQAIPAGLAVLSQFLAQRGQSYEQMVARL